MKHEHKYEAFSHAGITAELMETGIQAAEIRKCRSCQKEMPFLLTKKGKWVPLFDDKETDAQDILLA